VAEKGGYAFVNSPSFEKTLFLHISDTLNSDTRTLEKDVEVAFDDVCETDKGPKVTSAFLLY
jgi:cold shock CspA family protein